MEYTDSLHSSNSKWALESAEIIAEELYEIDPNISTVIDIGCGLGAFLKMFDKVFRFEYFIGVDHPEINKDLLLIDKQGFIGCDLENEFYHNYSDDRFDLAICLETAEHLSESRARGLIESLCSWSDKVLFSAAIPGQGGAGHKNEQWQSYWIRLFNENGFYPIDLRPRLWEKERVKFWYKQNMFLYERGDVFGHWMPDVVHPDLWRLKNG